MVRLHGKRPGLLAGPGAVQREQPPRVDLQGLVPSLAHVRGGEGGQGPDAAQSPRRPIHHQHRPYHLAPPAHPDLSLFQADSKPYVQYSRDDDVQIVPEEKAKQTPSRAVAKKSTSRQTSAGVTSPFLPQMPSQSAVLAAPPSKIVVSTPGRWSRLSLPMVFSSITPPVNS